VLGRSGREEAAGWGGNVDNIVVGVGQIRRDSLYYQAGGGNPGGTGHINYQTITNALPEGLTTRFSQGLY
jgi:hypothetical protein